MDQSDGSSSLMTCSDQDLAEKCASGSPGCFEELVRRYRKPLFKYLQSRVNTPEDIEELIQETFIKAFCHIKRFNPEHKFSTWIYTISTRLMYSYFRTQKISGQNSELDDNLTGSEDSYDITHDCESIWEIAKQIDPMEFEVLKLRFQEELTLEEIAVRINKNPEIARIILHKARRNLARKFKDTPGDK